MPDVATAINLTPRGFGVSKHSTAPIVGMKINQLRRFP